MSKTAFLFPGQGVQKAGMGKDFYEHSAVAREIFDMASEVLQMDMKKLCFTENEKLNQTEYTQAALVTTCLAMARSAEAKGMKADVTAGLSLGEYCAIAISGGMYDREAVYAVRKRGILMEQAVPGGEGAMAAVLGLSADQVEHVLNEREDVFVANYNCPGQIVITGEADAVAATSEALKEAGAKRCVPLKVSGPFHSALLKTAGEQLAEELKSVKLSTPWIPYVSNVTADYVTDASQVAELLKQQVSSPVHFTQSVERMIADGVDTFIEIGPGKTLSSFVRKIDRNVKVYNIEKPEDLDRVMEELAC